MNDTSNQIQLAQSRILILVDNDILSHSLQDDLSNKGYDVKVAATYESLQMIWETWVPHLILLDMGLSDTNAFMECDQLLAKHTETHIPVILLCGREDPLYNPPLLDISKVADYVNKPIRTEELTGRIQRALNRAFQVGNVKSDS